MTIGWIWLCGVIYFTPIHTSSDRITTSIARNFIFWCEIITGIITVVVFLLYPPLVKNEQVSDGFFHVLGGNHINSWAWWKFSDGYPPFFYEGGYSKNTNTVTYKSMPYCLGRKIRLFFLFSLCLFVSVPRGSCAAQQKPKIGATNENQCFCFKEKVTFVQFVACLFRRQVHFGHWPQVGTPRGPSKFWWAGDG